VGRGAITLLPNKELVDHFGEATTAVAFPGSRNHYFVNEGFSPRTSSSAT